MDFTEDERERLALRRGDLLVCEGGEIGRTAVWNLDIDDCLFQNHLHRLRAKNDEVEPSFAMYWMQAAFLHLGLYHGVGNSTTIPNLSGTRLKQLLLPLPPRPEQKAIVSVLCTLQARVEVQKRIVATLKELKSATMAKLFREGLGGEALKDTEVGEIPANWSVVPFGRAVDIAKGQVDPRVEPYASMLHVGPEDVEGGTGRLLKPRTARDLALISGKYAFHEGDIVFSKIRPYLQKSILADFEGICSADMYPLRPAAGFDARFVHAVTLSPIFAAQAISQQDRTGIPKLNREQLRTISIPQPSAEEQQEIGQLLAGLDRHLRASVRYHDLFKSAFASLLPRLVSGAIRVSPLLEEQSR